MHAAIWKSEYVNPTPGEETVEVVLYMFNHGAYRPTLKINPDGSLMVRNSDGDDWVPMIVISPPPLPQPLPVGNFLQVEPGEPGVLVPPLKWGE